MDVDFGNSKIKIKKKFSKQAKGLIFTRLKHEFWLFEARMLSRGR